MTTYLPTVDRQETLNIYTIKTVLNECSLDTTQMTDYTHMTGQSHVEY